MVFRSFSAAAAAGVMSFVLTASLASAATPEEAIKARQECMKANGGVMKVAVPMFKGEAAFDAAALKAALDAEAAACAGWNDWWGEDTRAGGAVETWAKDEIWTDRAGFDAAGAKFVEARTAVAAATDEAAFKAAFPALGEGCKGCHDKYRRPKE